MQVHGYKVKIVKIRSCSGSREDDPRDFGLDGAIDFQPLSRAFLNLAKRSIFERIFYNFKKIIPHSVASSLSPRFSTERLIKYDKLIENDLAYELPNYPLFPGITPGWDNSPRRGLGKSLIFYGASTSKFKKWYLEKIMKWENSDQDRRLMFINAWNEWAEGAFLEPDHQDGLSKLNVLREVLTANEKS